MQTKLSIGTLVRASPELVSKFPGWVEEQGYLYVVEGEHDIYGQLYIDVRSLATGELAGLHLEEIEIIEEPTP